MLQAKLSDQIFDPFTTQEMAESRGSLLMHYQVPLLNANNNVFMMFKTGTYVPCVPPASGQPFPCGPNAWNTEVWNETDLQWQNGQLAPVWNFASDWTPVPNDYTLGGWEPLFQPVLASTYIYVPGAGGTIYQLDQATGVVLQQINPFGASEDPTKFVAGGLRFVGKQCCKAAFCLKQPHYSPYQSVTTGKDPRRIRKLPYGRRVTSRL